MDRPGIESESESAQVEVEESESESESAQVEIEENLRAPVRRRAVSMVAVPSPGTRGDAHWEATKRSSAFNRAASSPSGVCR